MAEDLLDRVLREVRERKKRAQAAWGKAAGSKPRCARSRASGHATGRSGRRLGHDRSSRARVPRGQTRDAILRVVAERPGATAAEIAAAAKLDRRVAQSILARLARQGAIERYSSPGGGTGYRSPSPTDDSESADAASPPSGGADEREPARRGIGRAGDTASEPPEREHDAPATDGETPLER